MNNYGNETRKFFSRIKRLTLNRENFVPRKFPNIRYTAIHNIKLYAITLYMRVAVSFTTQGTQSESVL